MCYNWYVCFYWWVDCECELMRIKGRQLCHVFSQFLIRTLRLNSFQFWLMQLYFGNDVLSFFSSMKFHSTDSEDIFFYIRNTAMFCRICKQTFFINDLINRCFYLYGLRWRMCAWMPQNALIAHQVYWVPRSHCRNSIAMCTCHTKSWAPTWKSSRSA